MKNFVNALGNKLHAWGKKGKALASALSIMTVSAITTIAVSAEEVGASTAYTQIGDAMKTGFTEMVTNTMTVLAGIVPIGIGVFGVYMCVGYAKKFFKKITA